MDIVDFFDITNIEHLKAYQVLINTGTWPKGFIPDGTTFRSQWNLWLLNRMSEAYISIKLSGQ